MKRRLDVRNTYSAFTPRTATPLEASILIDKDVLVAGEELTLDARGSVGSIMRYEWRFDGKKDPKKYGSLITYSFNESGKHHIRLDIFGPYRNLHDSAEVEINIMSAKEIFEYRKDEYENLLKTLETEPEVEVEVDDNQNSPFSMTKISFDSNNAENNKLEEKKITIGGFEYRKDEYENRLKTLETEPEVKVEADNKLEGKKITIGGSFKNFKRNELQEILTQKGAVVVDEILESNLFIAGTRAGKNKNLAEENGIEIWSEEELEKAL